MSTRQIASRSGTGPALTGRWEVDGASDASSGHCACLAQFANVISDHPSAQSTPVFLPGFALATMGCHNLSASRHSVGDE